MMVTFVYCSLAIVCMFINAGFGKSRTAIKTSVTIKVDNKDRAADSLIRKAETLGGYFLNWEENRVTIKLPREQADAFLPFCDSLGFPIGRSYETTDYTMEITQKAAMLKAKRSLLEDYFNIMKQSQTGSVFIVENAIVDLQQEIESLLADLKLMKHKIAFAEMQIFFQFKDRAAPVSTGTSVFKWLNYLNLSDLQEDFQYGLK